VTKLISAKRYARAIFELSDEANLINKIENELKLISEITKKDKLWINILDDLKLPIIKKQKLINDISEKINLNKYTLSLLNILINRRKIHLISNIYEEFNKLYKHKKGIISALITVSNNKIWKELKGEISEVVEKIGSGRPEINCNIDPSIIGGIIIKIGDRIYDGSIKGELNRLKKELLKREYEIN